MHYIFVNAVKVADDSSLLFDLETLITVFVYKICDARSIRLHISIVDISSKHALYKLDLEGVNYTIINDRQIPHDASNCLWPVILAGKTIIAGLCSVSRHMIKKSHNPKIKLLLGFRDACLAACSETSTWTKFCEVDIISTIKNITLNPENYFSDHEILIPADILRFECHMAQPVRMHNVYKVAREVNNDKAITSSTPITSLNLEHKFGEGSFITLADICLFPCFKIFYKLYNPKVIADHLPLTALWYKNVEQNFSTKLKFDFYSSNFSYDFTQSFVINKENFLKQSLYVADPKRYKPQNRIYTKQVDIESSLKKIKNSSILVSNTCKAFSADVEFSWEKIPDDISPLGGALPAKRAVRKCEQLQNLIKPVLFLAQNGDTIVDFCSGSGHLGLLIAVLLPQCNIILVENKEKSLLRAQERVNKLDLQNVTLMQCNLDYFHGHYDIGVSLHACGVATDLVIQKCIESRAHFVCCPCCYGGIHNCFHLEYPRSTEFKDTGLSDKEFLNLAHAADQTHDSNNVKTAQGYLCMDMIDTDRKLYAVKNGYEVHLCKLDPITCTPKNNLLVGLCSSKQTRI